MKTMEKIEEVMRAVAANPDAKARQADFDVIGQCTEAVVFWHNDHLKTGQKLMMAKGRLDEGEFAKRVHEYREDIRSVDASLVDVASNLNGICGRYGLDPVYEGKLDRKLGTADPDTHKGVTEFANALCYDYFHATEDLMIDGKAMDAYRKYHEQTAGKFVESPSESSMVLDMLRRANAQVDMDVRGMDDDQFGI